MSLQPNKSTNAGSPTTPLWNPGAILRVIDTKRTKKLTYNVTCVGRAARKYGAPCAWAIEDQSPEQAAAAVNILDNMAKRPPTEVTHDQLETLTHHCLCSYHTHQIASATGELKERLQPEVQHHRTRTAQEAQHAYTIHQVSQALSKINLEMQNVARLTKSMGIVNQTESAAGDPGAGGDEGSGTTQGQAANSSRNP
ncbi:hypothetical protein H2200_005263 [Cladophialophora chaetospira]|uniref:Uncharacterized protein n=1 Tax=Cladophialophora chaetospira TaxID=386627 RepID=A0AA39CJN4_9EURO|nr:hypothetical protein H2200_005263 [Cladophialophora chaetospira]